MLDLLSCRWRGGGWEGSNILPLITTEHVRDSLTHPLTLITLVALLDIQNTFKNDLVLTLAVEKRSKNQLILR